MDRQLCYPLASVGAFNLESGKTPQISIYIRPDHLAPSLGHLGRFLGSTLNEQLKFSYLLG